MKYSDAQIQAAVAKSINMADTLRELGLLPVGGNFKVLRKNVSRLSLNTSHWRRGAKPHAAHKPKRSLKDVLVIDSDYLDTTTLKRRLVQDGALLYQCVICGLREWCGSELVLHLDHINGVGNDNRITNLRLLCPNCHSQTASYCGRNKS
jgi:5-methylcytosine-specific restriction endonuclease McrA